MKGVVFVIVAIVFVTSAKAVPIEPKQVNLALETVLRFDNKDRAADLAVIDRVQNVLSKIKNAVQSRSGRKSGSDITFTDFVLEAAKILRKYNDDDLEDAYAIIDDESRRYINTESKLQDLFGNDIRRYINDQLDIAKDMPVETLRRHLNKAISALENKEETESNNDILNVGNTLYIGQSDKFKTALKKLDRLRRSNVVDLSQVLRDTLKSLVFDHYSNLNDNVKRELINIVRHYWKAFENDAKSLTKDDDLLKMVMTLRTSTVPPVHDTVSTRALKHNNRSPEMAKRYKVSKLSSRVVKTRDNRNKKVENEEKETTKWKNPETLFKLHYSMDSSTENTDDSKETSESESDRSELLTGGQQNIHLRVDTSSEDSDELEIIPKPKEIVIQHNNVIDVGLSRKMHGGINVSFVSEDSSKARRSDVGSGRRQFTVFPATISHEGISIESFETEDSHEQKNTRKSNMNITSITKLNLSDPANVKKLIEDIEKQIEDVKEKVEYVKSLNILVNDTEIESSQFKFKAIDSAQSSTKFLKSRTKTSISPNSAIIERENEAFLSEESIGKETTIKEITKKNSNDRIQFRADDDTDSIRNSSEEKTGIQSDSKETSKSTVKTNENEMNLVNHVNVTVNSEEIKLNLNETTDDNKIVNEASDNKEVNDNDDKDVTNVDTTNKFNSSHSITSANLDLNLTNTDAILDEKLTEDLALL